MFLKYIDNVLNKITMYRITLYGLMFMWGGAVMLSLFGLIRFTVVDLFLTLGIIFGVSVIINTILAYLYKVPSNIESVYITVFILALIVSPEDPLTRLNFLILVSTLAMASKYVIALYKKHIFNPAAFAVAVAALILGNYASWWIGTLYMAPFVFIGGFLIVRKIQREDLVLSFFITSVVLVTGYALYRNQDIIFLLKQAIIDSPWMFLAFVMLTEPMTTPPNRKLRIIYGVLVAFLFAPFVHIGNFYFSPEMALLAGNVFAYIVSPKIKYLLTLKEKITIAHNTFDFVFTADSPMKFIPGQYMEWTLGHNHADTRGIRRYFTIASSPTEKEVRIGVKFYEKPSSYKKALESLTIGNTIVASQLAGDFTLPADNNKKYVFLAGGIGVTPFRSMVKNFLDTQTKKDVVVFYSNKHYQDIAYKETFDRAKSELGIKTIYTLENMTGAPADFQAHQGFINKELILQQVPDYKERFFYISGPRSMILSFEKTLQGMGVAKSHIKTDFFPGFA